MRLRVHWAKGCCVRSSTSNSSITYSSISGTYISSTTTTTSTTAINELATNSQLPACLWYPSIAPPGT